MFVLSSIAHTANNYIIMNCQDIKPQSGRDVTSCKHTAKL